MRIESSGIAMSSSRSYREEAWTTQTEIRRYHAGTDNAVERTVTVSSNIHTKKFQEEGGVSDFAAVKGGGFAVQEQRRDGLQDVRSQQEPQTGRLVEDSGAGTAANAAMLGHAASATKGTDWLSGVADAIDHDPKIQMLRKCLELLERATGRRVSGDTRLGGRKLSDVMGVSAFAVSARYQKTMAAFSGSQEVIHVSRESNPNGYWTRQTVLSGFVQGEERTAFSSTGTVVTSDGRTLDFGIHVEMSRSFEKAMAVEGKEAVYTDPLVINLDTDAASLSDVTFAFDLDGDGKKEELSALGEGSGFLALDKNGDGTINDGSELFGAKTGDGFGELSRYDEDGNGWIDENDSVFARLTVWMKCGGGEGKQLSLRDAGVGAIFLGSQETQHTLENAAGEESAVVRRTGLYLKESGEAGTVQHLDFRT